MDFNSGPSFVLMSGNRVWIATISGTGAASASSSRRSFVTSWAFATISGTGIDTGACGAAPLSGVPGAGGVFCGASAGRTVAGAGEAGAPTQSGAVAIRQRTTYAATTPRDLRIRCSGSPGRRAPYWT